MPVNTRQKCYDTDNSIKFKSEYISSIKCNSNSMNETCPFNSKRVSVGNCKYRRVIVENIIEQVDRGRNQIFSPLSIKDRLRSARRKFI